MAEFRGGGGGWNGFGDYMRDKTHKLSEQYDQRFVQQSDIFSGKTFWFSGRMEGVDFDMKEVITIHGGLYEQYGFRNVSHIIASNLATSNQNWKKLLGGRHSSKPFVVVTPQWVIDSIQVGKCVSESMYLPECIRVSGTLDAFFESKELKSGALISDMRDTTSGEFVSRRLPVPSFRSLVRHDIENPIDSAAVVDEFCYEFMQCKLPLLRKGFVSLTESEGTSVFAVSGLDSVSLAEALLNDLNGQDWSNVKKVSLHIYSGIAKGDQLQIMPNNTDPPPTALNTKISTLLKLLKESQDDTLQETLNRVIQEGASSINAVILEAVGSLIASNRADRARNILVALNWKCRVSNDVVSRYWFKDILNLTQQVFQFHNNGARMGLL